MNKKLSKARRKYCIERSKQLRTYAEGGNVVRAWFYTEDGKPYKSNDLMPVRLPVGKAASIASLFRCL